MEIGSKEAAWEHVHAISRAFPESARAAKLKGMYLEAGGLFSEAEALYKAELEKDSQNKGILRRMASF